MSETLLVVMKVHDYESWSEKRREDVARWLHAKAEELEQHKEPAEFASVVTFRYFV